MADLAYIRVSTTDQNTDRQLSGSGLSFKKQFTDRCSGGTTNRPALEDLKEYAREGDTVHVHSIDSCIIDTCCRSTDLIIQISSRVHSLFLNGGIFFFRHFPC